MRTFKTTLKILLALLFIGAGISHFANPALYLKVMPPYLPDPLLLIHLSGFLEIVLGVCFLIPRWTRPAAWGLILLLIAVFPANLHMALHADLFPQIPTSLLWVRLPLQGVLILWAYAYTRPEP
jgi:uncharacterized membrane protein